MGKSAEALAADAAGPPPLRGSLVAAGAEAIDTITLTDDTTLTNTEKAFAEVLAGVLKVQHVPVDLHFFDDLGADSMLMAQFCARVRKRPEVPNVSMKDIYQHPTIRRLADAVGGRASIAGTASIAPTGPIEQTRPIEQTPPIEQGLAEVLAGVLKVDRVPVDGHFFDDLGADSMLMAQFCARVRKRQDLPKVSMKDIYRNPTITGLANTFADAVPHPVESSVPVLVQPSNPGTPAPEPPHRASTRQYVLCGALQFLFFLMSSFLLAVVAAAGYEWVTDARSPVGFYLRGLAFGMAVFTGVCALPIAAKWVLIGKWKPREIPVWSLTYLRFWIVKTLLRSSPLALLFHGSPLYVFYLRALGAKVGRGVAIFSPKVPVCTDLLTIGDGTVIRKDSFFLGYQAHAGRIRIGSVTLGQNVFVGEKTVLDINTAMGDGSQLGHASALYAGMTVPAGERWHGSPAEPTDVDYAGVPAAPCGTLRRFSYCLATILQVIFLWIPLAESGLYALLEWVPWLKVLRDEGMASSESIGLYAHALILSLLFFGSLPVGLGIIFAVPRVLNLFFTPGKVYPLYGFHYGLHRTISRMTNVIFYMHLFGDSSYVVNYLRGLGYDLSTVEQTGSNFGTQVRHETPYMSRIGSGTMVADGLSMMNAEYSNSSFRVCEVSVGARSFLGNDIVYPPGGRVGDNCLLGTKVMVPLDGKVREGVGLLGSPCFEIPRTVARDAQFDDRRTGDALRRNLSAKNRYNLRSMAFFLFTRWLHIFVLTLLALLTVDLYGLFSLLAVTGFFLLSFFLSTAYLVLVERAVALFRHLKPQYCSIYDPYFWWHERLWKVTSMVAFRAFDGTPFKNLIWRSLGVRIGKRVFDDGCAITERTLTVIGDDCTLNESSTIQCHSQEDGAFKADRTTIGAGCTLGVDSFVHYGVTMGEGSVLAPDSFLMKGTEVAPREAWGGNPARDMSDDLAPLQGSRYDSADHGAVLIQG